MPTESERSTRLVYVLLVTGQAAGLWGMNMAEARDVFPGKDWQQATPESQAVDGAKLNAAVTYLDANFGDQGARELVIVRNGYLIWKGPESDAYHNVWSCTKNYTSTLLGVLVGAGKCRLDDFAVKYLPHLADKYPAYARIRLRQLASMSSGYRGELVGQSSEQPWGEPMHYLKPAGPDYEPGTEVAYQDHQVFVLGQIITQLAGESERDFFKEHIADPIGMTQWDWGVSGEVDGVTLNNAAGTPNTPGIQTSACEMARLGLLYLNQGNWAGKPLLPASFVKEATKNQVRNAGISRDLRGRYGFFWRNNDIMANGERMWPSAPPKTYMSNGNGCNFCIVLPEWNIVVVRMGTHPVPAVDRQARFDTFFRKLGEALGAQARLRQSGSPPPPSVSARAWR